MNEITAADRQMWDDYGAEIFHGAFTGPALVALVRSKARERAIEEAAKVADDHAERAKPRAGLQDNESLAFSIALMVSEHTATAIRALANQDKG